MEVFTNVGCPLDVLGGDPRTVGEPVVLMLPHALTKANIVEVHDTHAVAEIVDDDAPTPTHVRLFFKLDDCPDRPQS